MYDAILQKSDTISEKWMPQFLIFLESFVSRIVVTRKGGGRVAHVKSGSSGIIDAVIIATRGGLRGQSLSGVVGRGIGTTFRLWRRQSQGCQCRKSPRFPLLPDQSLPK